MENEKKKLFSKLKSPTNIKLPSKLAVPSRPRLEFISKTTENIPAVVNLTRNRMRRSKSYSELTSVITKNTLKRPIINVQARQASVKPLTESKSASNVRQATKRPAVDKVPDLVKPKVVRANPPKYDFKARFNILDEKHKQLVVEHKKLKENFASVNEQLNEVTYLKEENKKKDVKLKEFANLKCTFDVLKVSHESTSNALKVAEEKIEAYEKELAKYEVLKEKHKSSEEDNEKLREDLRSISREIENKSNRITSLERDLIERNEEYENLNLKKNNLDTELMTAKDKLVLLTESVRTYKTELQEMHETRRCLHNQVQDLKGNIRVFCRVRGTIETENDKLLANINYLDETSLELKHNNVNSANNGKIVDFSFDKVFPPQTMQEEVFEDLAQLVQSTLDGYNVCVFAYGQTGSGKTYTMQGTDEQIGMIPRSMDLLFERIEQLESSGWTYKVKASFLEIYNESIKDLLDPNSSSSYEIKFNEGKGTTVTNLTIQAVSTSEQLKQLIRTSTRNRAVASTNYNEHSSRSHAVTKVYVEGHNSVSQTCYVGSLNLIDLAGSESAKTSSSERIAETKCINKSLSSLGTVMLALHNGERHVPYRNSKLTFLLQPCLGGNSKTLMFINISPFEECFNETISSLRFATKVKDVKVSSKRNKIYK